MDFQSDGPKQLPTLADTDSPAPATPYASPKADTLSVRISPERLALCVIATVAAVFALYAGKKFFIPLIFGVLISFALNPLVVWLERIRVPRSLGASMIILLILAGAVWAGNTLRIEFQTIVEQLPQATRELSRAITRNQSGRPTAMQQMQEAASEIEKATSPPAGRSATKPAPVVVTQPSVRLSDLLWAGSMGAIGLIGQITMVSLLVFFLLLSGDTFKRKLVKLVGPSISTKKTALHILDDIHLSIQNYMLMLVTTNTVLALMMWVAFRLLGLENAGAWAIAAGLLHVIPYFGSLLVAMASGLTAFMQFGSVYKMLLVAGVSVAIATVVGMVITTWMTGKIAQMNAASVFIILLFWGWLWGIWGMLLGIPIIVITKVIAEHLNGLHTFRELVAD